MAGKFSSASAAHANSGFYRRRAALIALLVLLTVAAGCAAGGLLLGASFSKEAQPAAARSPFAGWSFEEKLSLLNTLKEQGADASAIPDLSRRTEQEADEALIAALERLCPTPAVSPRALGAFSDSWGLEEKARYSQMLLANGLGNQAAEINLLPEKTDMSAQGAERRAKQLLLQLHEELTADALEQLTACVSYYRKAGGDGTRYWSVRLRDKTGALRYTVVMTREGLPLEMYQAEEKG